MENQTNAVAAAKEEQSSFNYRDAWNLFLSNWYWFLISVVFALAVATYYLVTTPPVYTRTAQLLVKDDSKRGRAGGGGLATELKDFGILANNTSIQNELITIQSPELMTEVVKRLHLDETYYVHRRMKNINLYQETPLLVTFTDQRDVENVAFTIEMTSNKGFVMRDFVRYNEEGKKENVKTEVKGLVETSVKTPVGTVAISLTKEFTPKYLNTPIKYSKHNPEYMGSLYAKALGAELVNKEATVISLSISDPSIKKAEDILNTLVEVYNEVWIKDKNVIAETTASFIDERLAVIERELSEVDDNISNYKSKNLLPDVVASSALNLQQSSQLRKEEYELMSQLSIAQYIRSALQQKNYSLPLPVNSGFDNTAVSPQITAYNTVVFERQRLISSSSENNPVVRDLTTTLEGMHGAISKSVDNAVTALNMQLSNLRKQLSSTVGQLASSPNQANYLLSVERQQKVKEQLYIYLLQKREENNMSKAFTAYNSRVITLPRGPVAPTSPRRMMVLLIALILGLAIPAVIFYLRETMNTRVRGRKDLEALSAPYLGEIPLYGKQKRRYNPFKKHTRKDEEHPVVVKALSRNVINEAFRVVRSNLEFMLGSDGKSKVIMFTSANPGSGKTFLALNLAVCFSIKHKKVLAIDFDMRRASLSECVNKPKTGLSKYLNGLVPDWHDVLVKNYNNEYLDILPVGALPPNPTELLFSDRLEKLITEVREEYDLIFFDCPPVEIVADTSILSRWVDKTLFVIRAGLMEREMLPRIDANYKEKKLVNMSILLNGTTTIGSGRYGYHRYGYRYGYNYGYGNYASYASNSDNGAE